MERLIDKPLRVHVTRSFVVSILMGETEAHKMADGHASAGVYINHIHGVYVHIFLHV